jgi:AcrR family transcriptional regulator
MGSSASPPAKATRINNRREDLLDAAARLFNEHGFAGSSVRDIAAAAGILPGSVYYHFRSKEELLIAVHEEGIRRISEGVRAALTGVDEPWTRLERAAAAHLKAILDESDYAAVVIRAFPPLEEPARQRLVALRDGYENVFRELTEALPLPTKADRRYLRLTLLGALNWSPTWYRPGGDPPERIATRIVGLLRRPAVSDG